MTSISPLPKKIIISKKMIIKENSTFKLVQTITDQILLVMKGIYNEPVLRVWHISQRKEAMNELRRIS